MKIHLQNGLEMSVSAFLKFAQICVNEENLDTTDNATVSIGSSTGHDWIIEPHPSKPNQVHRRRL